MLRVFGRQVAEGPRIANTYDVRTRPYIGTTTMDALISHITANAVHIMPGDRVLDPFCGTGSLLLPCAYLGADVVGSDIDGDCLGALEREALPASNRSKNSNFIRHTAALQELQVNGSALSNFFYYGLGDRVKGLFAMDAMDWCGEQAEFGVFDAIVSDPPFGIREKTRGESSGQPLVVLFRIAKLRLRLGGRMAFWMPTEAFTSEPEVRRILSELEVEAGGDGSLVFVKAIREELNNKLWRWLCVYEMQSVGE